MASKRVASVSGVQNAAFSAPNSCLMAKRAKKSSIRSFCTNWYKFTQNSQVTPSTGLLLGESAPTCDPGHDRGTNRSLAQSPCAGGSFGCLCTNALHFCRHRFEHRDDRGEFIGRGIAADDTHFLAVRHSGMFPCFFGGRLARLVRSARNALMTATLVAAGSMMPSSSPRSAARNGLATL